MKYFSIIIGALGLLTAQSVISASCTLDKEQMLAQISSYGSISSQGCPFNRSGVGINTIANPVAIDHKICIARCQYASGVGSSGRDCSWKMGDWGNTLTCSI